METRREREKATRRQWVVDTAEQLFRQQGFENTQMDQIAAQAEFSKTTLYNYFASKDELAVLVYQRLHTRKMDRLCEAIETEQSPSEQLRALGVAYLRFFEEHPDSLSFQLYWDHRGLDRTRIREEVCEGAREFIAEDAAYLSDIIRRGIADGSFRDDIDPAKVMDLLYLTLRAVLNQLLLIGPGDRLGSFVDTGEEDYMTFLDMLIRSLRP